MKTRLSAMMFLQFAIFGAWAPVLGLYLKAPGPMGFSGTQTGLVYMTLAIASILAPLVAGQIADRYFSTQYFLALVHFVGGWLMFALARVPVGDFWTFFGLMFLYQLMFAPTMSLTSSLAFHHLADGKQFGRVRLWGTLGWIAIGLTFGEWLKDWSGLRYLLGEETLDTAGNLALVGQCLNWAGVLSLVMSAYCLTLPSTPPSRSARPFAFLDALGLLKLRPFAVLLLVSMIVATELQFYYVFGINFFHSLGFDKGTAGQLLTLGQVVEVVTLLALPWFTARYGLKATILLGISAWSLRYALFAIGQPVWLMVASQGLHGLAFGFFFVGGQIYTDRVAGPAIRASAQGLFVLTVLGIGKLLSSLIAGPIVDAFTSEGAAGPVTNWHGVFLAPMALTAVGGLFFLFAFHDQGAGAPEDETTSAAEEPAAAKVD